MQYQMYPMMAENGISVWQIQLATAVGEDEREQGFALEPVQNTGDHELHPQDSRPAGYEDLRMG
jgi:hypothetical protein